MRSRRKSHRDEIVSGHQRGRPDFFVAPVSPLIHRIGPVDRLFSSSLGMNSRKLAVVFETLNTDKSVQAAYRQLANSGESGQVLDEGDYMMHLRSRKLQAFDDC